MKTIFLSLLLLTGAVGMELYSQITPDNTAEVIDFIADEWTWRISRGGLSGTDIVNPETAGYQMSLVFTEIPGSPDSIAYSLFYDDISAASGYAGISFSNTFYGEGWNLDSIAGFNSGKVQLLLKSSDSLELAENCYDCYSHSFIRKSIVSTSESLPTDNSPVFFPNPCRDIISVDLNENTEPGQLIIYRSDGTVVAQKEIVNSFFDLTGLPAGVYFISLVWGQKVSCTKIVKE